MIEPRYRRGKHTPDTSMTQTLEDWPRAYLAGDGGCPYLFYVVFGSDVSALKLSRSARRCDAVPEGIEVMDYGADRHPEVRV